MNYNSFELFNAEKSFLHGFTYRNGGIAELPFGNQHMGVLSSHFREEAWTNIVHLVSQLGLKALPQAIVCTEQVHEDHLEDFKSENWQGEEIDGFNRIVLPRTDGVFTQEKNVLLMTFYADCTPVYFLDPIKNAFGMVHSGWKGTRLKISSKAVNFMIATYGSELKDLKVVIGPSAGVCCYEVDQKVYDQFPEFKHCFKETKENYYKMNMKQIILECLVQEGIKIEQIEVSQECTICQTERYFSYRREAGYTGRMAAFMIRP